MVDEEEDFGGFGGGLGRFLLTPPIINTCRELVEVPGGPEWKIRKLQNDYPDVCWKYPGNSVIVNYHFKRILNCEDPEDQNQKMFYGKVSHFMSPLEISIQPKYLGTARKSIMEQLNTQYQFRKPDNFSEVDQIFAGVACAVQELGIWYRATIRQISGEEHLLVELIDFGTQILVARHQILPLIRKFGKAPPLCLKCRADGLTVNDLEVKDLHDFKNTVAECNALFRVEIKSVEEPYLVDLYHPTVTGLNVCRRFFAPPEDLGKIDRYERSWEAHCMKMNEETPDDVDFDEPPPSGATSQYIRRLPRCERAPRFEQDVLLAEHIENSQLIYLQYPWQVEKRRELDEALESQWSTFAAVPEEWRQEDQLVAIRNPRRGIVRRALIIDTTTVLLVDYGRFVKCPENSDLRLLPADSLFMQEPMLTIISMTRGINQYTPHHSETLFLRKKLPKGTKVHFKWDKKSKTTPLRGYLSIDGDANSLNNQMVKHLKSLKIDGHCRQVDIYRPRDFHVLPRGDYVYHATCHLHYSKGIGETR